MCARARRREEAQRAESSEWHMRHVSDPPACRVQCVSFCRRGRGVFACRGESRERERSSLYYGELCIVSGTACAERVMSICSSCEKLVGRGIGSESAARGGAASRKTTGKKKPGSTLPWARQAIGRRGIAKRNVASPHLDFEYYARALLRSRPQALPPLGSLRAVEAQQARQKFVLLARRSHAHDAHSFHPPPPPPLTPMCPLFCHPS